MILILALRAVLLLINACVVVANAISIIVTSSKPRANSATTKQSNQKQQVNSTGPVSSGIKKEVLRQLQITTPRSQQLLLTQHAHNARQPQEILRNHLAEFYHILEVLVCAGLVYQHAILHLNLPVDLLAGFSVNFRVLLQAGILLPDFMQSHVGIIAPIGPHEEPVYWKRFRLTIDFRTLLGADLLLPGFEAVQLGEEIIAPEPHEEPAYVKPFGRVNRPQRISITPVVPDAAIFEEFQHTDWDCMSDNELRKRIAFYQDRVARGLPSLYAGEDMPEARDYVTKHLFDKSYNWNLFHLAYERDPEGTLWMLDENPEMEEKSNLYRHAAEEYQKLNPGEFERLFPGSLRPFGFGDDEEATVATTVPIVKANVSFHDRHFSSDSGYASANDHLGEAGVAGAAQDSAITKIVHSGLYWSDFPGANDISHESCISLEEYAIKMNTTSANTSPVGYFF